MNHSILGEICEIEKGKTGITKAISGKYPLVVTAEQRSSHNSYQFDKAAVCIPLVSSTGHGHASLNRIHYQEGKFALGSILAAIIPKNTKILHPKYLYIYLSTYKDFVLVPLMKGGANVSMTIGNLKTAKFVLPSYGKQLEIIELYESTLKTQKQLSESFQVQQNKIEQLRQSILQEAVQGKLTQKWRKENPDVEPAEKLLERIQAKKSQLIKEKKTRKDKPLPPIKSNEITTDLPSDWVWCRIGDIASVKGGKRVPKGYQLLDSPTSHAYIRVKDMSNGTVNQNNLKYLSDEVYESIKKYTISKNDLYITIAGTIGLVGEIPPELDNMNLTENAAKLVFSIIEKKYFKIALLSGVSQSQFAEKVNQMAQPKLALKRIRTTIIPLPPLKEQKDIVSKVEHLMALYDALEKQVVQSKENADLLMQSVLQEVFNDAERQTN